MIHCLQSKHTLPEDTLVINVTSYSTSFGRELSPFNVGPVELYDGHVAQNLENAFQFAKIYSEHNFETEPSEEYWEWAKAGWANPKPIKYPFGAWNKCLFHWWKGEKLDRLRAQNEIFVPLYCKAVVKTDAFKKLKEIYQTANQDIILIDFEGYSHRFLDMTYDDVLNHPTFPIGQGFVLCMLLDGFLKEQ